MKEKKLIIFGLSEQAEMAYYYFSNDSNYEVVAFTVDKKYKNKDTLFSLPIVDFDALEEKYSNLEYELFVAIGYNQINRLREQKYLACKNKGYKIASYISTKATIFTEDIGENVFILEDNTIQPYVKIGNNVTLWSGNHIGHHTEIKDHCFISSHVVISGGCLIKENTFIGVNATLRDHITVGQFNVIGGGAIIMGDTADQEVYVPQRTERFRLTSDKLKKI